MLSARTVEKKTQQFFEIMLCVTIGCKFNVLKFMGSEKLLYIKKKYPIINIASKTIKNVWFQLTRIF